MNDLIANLALYGAGALSGAALLALGATPFLRKRRQQHEAQQAQIQALTTRITAEELTTRLAAVRDDAATRQDRALAQQQAGHERALEDARREAETEAMARADNLLRAHEGELISLRRALLAEHEAVTRNIESLLDIMKIVERWHDEMQAILSNNDELREQNAEFSRIVKHVVILSLNASIEAARAGEHGLGFAVVADGVRDLADTASRWALHYKENLDKNDFITTTTFQDIQASGSMIRTAVLTLKAANEQIGRRIADHGSAPCLH
ncbi:MAG: chemotaxis protein [Candidatus Dactylopiibacterium carminicum]|uniref:Chemotaxis protein n=1 Tax=Candidatus Dactylopiibacterium carminicum TaxID=857335 RepID=A0A272EQ68_9RHOO|nr:methyl-accepting chemotaxis protein [Candidatus Dactylopiibacterium carminicum]KAF7598510.1 chemotaxis protein [Candidatus Dactylopiibacterium carminicum]PAS92259.1 MAG: chemotaxis protein [Candidatus Dactylopiibacterium carminicum]PAS95773.1 MAG: chemotaxis protein [Candidatus Dactylopiibacterium carminicum]PAS97997.1 MAG: hypothetical protein BSR46_12805 [Candidatus Dactylopiibacterium carminicum]